MTAPNFDPPGQLDHQLDIHVLKHHTLAHRVSIVGPEAGFEDAACKVKQQPMAAAPAIPIDLLSIAVSSDD